MSHMIETERLLLRPWTSEDVALLAALSSNPRVTRYIGNGHTWTALKAITVSDVALGHWREHGFGWRVVIHVASGTEIGLLALNLMGAGTAGLEPDEHEIGWWLSPEHWGHGYATEAARAVAADAFKSLGAPHLTARIQPENAGSIQVATSIGMSFEFNTVAEPGVLVAVYRAAAPAVDELAE
jgi:RimJ/RimL family protein N-acetyltransferase